MTYTFIFRIPLNILDVKHCVCLCFSTQNNVIQIFKGNNAQPRAYCNNCEQKPPFKIKHFKVMKY